MTAVVVPPKAPFMVRHGRNTLFWAVAVVVLAVVATLLLWPDIQRSGADPDNPNKAGLKAVHRVLVHEGIDTRVVRDSHDLAGITSGPDTTLVISAATALSDSSLTRLDQAASRFGRVVLLGLPAENASRLGVDVDPSYQTSTGTVAADCDSPFIGQAQRLSLPSDVGGTSTYIPVTGGTDLSTCFGQQPKPGVAPGSFVAATTSGQERIAVSTEAPFSNQYVTNGDNAALALTLLGSRPHLVWAHLQWESDSDVSAPTYGIAAILPPWWESAQQLLTWTVIVAMLWQLRRFGPLVTERLPVVVKAIETTVNRGQLYQRAGDRGHVVAALQKATRERLLRRLALPPDLGTEGLVHAVSTATGRPIEEVQRVLTDTSSVTSDETMVLRAQALSLLEEEVRQA